MAADFRPRQSPARRDPSAHFLGSQLLLHGDWVIVKDALRHLVLPALTLAGGRPRSSPG